MASSSSNVMYISDVENLNMSFTEERNTYLFQIKQLQKKLEEEKLAHSLEIRGLLNQITKEREEFKIKLEEKNQEIENLSSSSSATIQHNELLELMLENESLKSENKIRIKYNDRILDLTNARIKYFELEEKKYYNKFISFNFIHKEIIKILLTKITREELVKKYYGIVIGEKNTCGYIFYSDMGLSLVGRSSNITFKQINAMAQDFDIHFDICVYLPNGEYFNYMN